jgi:acetylornithine deacetylase/succinyl-diaminopimelate desuccinylase-like protein
VPELTAPPNTYDLLNKRWCSPSLSIVDIRTTTTSNNSSSSSSSKPAGLREYAHSAAVTQRSNNAGGGSFTVVQQQGGRLGGCVHGSHSGVECGSLWPSVSVTHTEKHGAAEAPSFAGAGGADERSCYRFGPTRFSVIPKVAVGKISLRFVPEQDHQTLIECLQQHIEKRFKLLWSANKVELQVGGVWHCELLVCGRNRYQPLGRVAESCCRLA